MPSTDATRGEPGVQDKARLYLLRLQQSQHAAGGDAPPPANVFAFAWETLQTHYVSAKFLVEGGGVVAV